MDKWFEEDEEIFLHPRNPYHRIDTINSSRHIEVYVNDVKIADSTNPSLLFETRPPTRYYIPEEDVEVRYLISTDLKTVCPYKGFASYYDVNINGQKFENIVWYYPQPIPEAPKLAGKLAFWAEKDKRIKIVIDGESL